MTKVTTPTLDELNARMLGIGEVSKRFSDCLEKPLRDVLGKPNPVLLATAMFRLPMEAAAAGFDVHIVQKDDGWHLEIRREIDADCEFHVYARASGLVSAVIQITENAAQTLSQLSSDTRALMRAEIKQATPAA